MFEVILRRRCLVPAHHGIHGIEENSEREKHRESRHGRARRDGALKRAKAQSVRTLKRIPQLLDGA